MKLLYSCLVLFLLSSSIHSQPAYFEWATSSGGTSEDQGQSIITDDAGFIYVVGYFSGTVDFDPSPSTFYLTSNGGKDVFIQKLNPNSSLVWAKSFGGNGDDVCNSIELSSSGDIYLTGQFVGTVDFDPGVSTTNLVSNGGIDIFIQKLDANGDLSWAKSFGDLGDDRGFDIGTDESGNIYITGDFNGTVDFDPYGSTYTLTSNGDKDVFIQKLDMSGSFIWCKSIGGLGIDYASSLDVDFLGNVYLTGSFYSDSVDFDPAAGSFYLVSNGISDIFVQKLDQAGNFNWAVNMGSWNADFGRSVVCDTLGNVYTTGSFFGSVDFDPSAAVANLMSNGSIDGYIQKLDTDGNYIWAKSFGGSESEYSESLTIDNWGGVYAIGAFDGTADFDPSVTTSNLSSNGSDDVFIEKLNSEGEFIWAKSMGSYSFEVGKAITVDNFGNIFTTGSFKHTVDFDPSTNVFDLSANGNTDVFVQKLNQPSVSIYEVDEFNNILIFPNPNQGIVNIDLGELLDVTINIYSNSGRLVYSKSGINNPDHLLEFNGASGVYILELVSSGAKRRYKIIKQ